MQHSGYNSLPPGPRTAMIHVLAVPTLFALLLLDSVAAEAAEKNRPAGDDLDVTMQIIVDPDAKLPDEVIHRIALPARKPEKQPTSSSDPAKSNADAKGQERAKEAKELGSEMSERAKERAQEANDQREAARRAIADEKRPDKPPHPDPPNRPPH